MKGKIILFTAIIAIMLLTSCAPSAPDVSVMMKDLQGQELRTDYGPIVLELESVDSFQVLHSELNEDTRTYNARASFSYQRNYSSLKMVVDLSYLYVPDEDWKLQGITLDDFETSIEYTSSISTDDLTTGITDRYIGLGNSNGYWTLTEPLVSNVTGPTYDDNGYSVYQVDVVSSSDYEQMTGTLELVYGYNFRDDQWDLFDVDTISSSRKLIKGIDHSELIDKLDNETLHNIFTDDESHALAGLKWYIRDTSEIQLLSITNSVIDENDYTDIVECEVQLSKDNLVSRGSIRATVALSDRGWRLQDLAVLEKFDYETITPISRTVDVMKVELNGQSFNYKSGWWGTSWYIESDSLESLTIHDQYPSEYGNEVMFLVDMKLKGKSNYIKGSAYVTYKLNPETKNWRLIDVDRVNDFETEEFSESEAE